MKTKKNKRLQRNRTTLAARSAAPTHQNQPFTAHLLELRRRMTWVGFSVAAGATLAYFVQQHIVAVLLKPAGRQEFIYTSPAGGLNFLIQICLYCGVLISIPVIVYNTLKFIEPVMPRGSTRAILRGSAAAGLLAVAGVAFGYFFGLPSALKFLAHQFTTDQIRALIAVQSYIHFVSMFLLASALIFQAPLIMLLINRIRPLRPGRLMSLKNQRWVILISFILGAVISPTPDIRSMMILSVPMIVAFDIGIALVWQANRRGRKPKHIMALLEQDMAVQAERLQRLESIIALQFRSLAPEPVPVLAVPEPLDIPEAEEAPAAAMAEVRTAPPAATQTPPRTSGRTDYQTMLSARRVRRRLVQL